MSTKCCHDTGLCSVDSDDDSDSMKAWLDELNRKIDEERSKRDDITDQEKTPEEQLPIN